ncbi:hypothetical protein E2F43_18280 [Seongchinamella unica]|uniref:Uncharacterized protein n=1 Tax=Seongchinamella unica TaxID=2547392 RepID=A0A4R5LNA0_9GAMM|nr:hypothetical protein [Seongchinamella unica]TDG11659.1 hypothetical protein E2F43_18280 [Seongchinamella unica]
MTTNTHIETAPHPRWVLLATIGTVALAWSGILDELSTRHIDNALLGSGAIYATARGINALVSVLQGTEMNAFLLTFTVGELLDPVNDLIERFSGVMMLALGSLALQKILLEVVSDATFNILLTVLGVAVIATSYFGFDSTYRKLARFFLVTVVIRFSFALMILANSWADAVFLDEGVKDRHEDIRSFHNELTTISARAGIETGIADEIETIEEQIVLNEKAQEDESTTLYLNRTRLEEAEAKLKAADQRPWWRRLPGETTIEIEELKIEIQKLEEDIEGGELTLSGLREIGEALREKLDCLGKRSAGETCSFFERFGKAAQSFNIRKQLDKIADRVDAFSSNLISLLMALILKSVIFPLLFLYILVRASRFAL